MDGCQFTPAEKLAGCSYICVKLSELSDSSATAHLLHISPFPFHIYPYLKVGWFDTALEGRVMSPELIHGQGEQALGLDGEGSEFCGAAPCSRFGWRDDSG